ncbi:MAG: FAD:protein FMN transferase [Oscillospiraceae bacterium]|nr:FAD:protein FMN transferase [Oscillospiraceae bacterium]
MDKKKIAILNLAWILILTASLSFSGCKTDMQEASQTEEIFGTIVSVKAYGENAEGAVFAAFEKARELEKIFSLTITDSEINYVNQNAFKDAVKVSDDMFYLACRADYFSRLSGGAFDYTIGKLVDLWGIGNDWARVPKTSEIDPLVGLHDYKNIVIDSQNHEIKFKTDTAMLNFGAIAKGYIADEMKSEILKYGVKSALLNLGGNVLAIGKKPDGSLWRIGIANPFNPSNNIAFVEVADCSVVTSGNYEKYFEEDGVRYHHILNPETGFPSKSGLAGTTVISPVSADCDALSTATFILGVEKSVELIESLNGVEAIFISENGDIISTNGISKYHFKEIN